MVKFTASQPAFASEYKAARSIVDPANRASKKIVAANTNTTQTKAA